MISIWYSLVRCRDEECPRPSFTYNLPQPYWLSSNDLPYCEDVYNYTISAFLYCSKWSPCASHFFSNGDRVECIEEISLDFNADFKEYCQVPISRLSDSEEVVYTSITINNITETGNFKLNSQLQKHAP